MNALEKAVVRKRALFLAAVALPVIIADQITKFLVVKNLTVGKPEAFDRFWSQAHPFAHGTHEVASWWSFQYVENPGAAWGLLAGLPEGLRAPFFLLVSLGAMAMILYYVFRSPEDMRLRQWALALVFGGAIGNFVDRIRLGYVIDFVDWHLHDVYHWPTFNVADAGISIGVVLLLIESFVYPEAKKARAS